MPRKLFTHVPTRARVQHDVDDELRFHLDARTEELIRLGSSPEEARRIALDEYGDVTAARAELASIDRRRVGKIALREWLSSWMQDVRFALRGLRARPGFSLTILFTLALGIGANAAIFSVVDSVLLRPLPFAQPDRLVHLWEVYKSNVDGRSEASYPDYLDFRARNKTLTDLAGYHGGGFLLGGATPMTIGGGKCTANFFDVLGVKAAYGRTFVEGEDVPGAPRVVVLSYGFWQRQFAGDPHAVGKTLTLDGAPATIVGVLPRSFQFGRMPGAEVWTPLDRIQQIREMRASHWLNVVGRLKPNATLATASQDFSSIMQMLATEYPQSNKGRQIQIVPLHEEFVGSVRPVLLLLYGAVAVVLLISCVNVANLLLIRGADREREIAVRVALGAGRGRLVRQLLTESVLLAALGGLLGLGVAKLGVVGLLGVLPAHPMRGIPDLGGIGIDPRIVFYCILISLVAGIGFGIVPALRFVKPALQDTLRGAGRGMIGGASRLRDALVAGEIALTVVLLSGALLFGRSVLRLLAIDPGFRSDNVMTTTVVLPSSTFGSAQSRVAFFQRFTDRVRELPGVKSVGLVSRLPLDFGNSVGFTVVGQPAPDPSNRPQASYREASADYFETMGIPIASGRAFGAGDDLNAPTVAVVNRALVAAYFNGADPVGQRLMLGRDTALIVGVVGDVPIGKIEDKIPPTLYLPSLQDPQTVMGVAIRTRASAEQTSRSLRSLLSGLEPSAAMNGVTSMDDVIITSPSVFLRKLPLYLVGAFAFTALLLAIVGIYGVVSYSVAQRTREMGIRMALGAQPGSLVALVMRHGGWMAATGIVAGVAGSLVVGRFADSLLYGVRASDPLTYLAVGLVLSIVAVSATILPARRATRVDPALALRSE